MKKQMNLIKKLLLSMLLIPLFITSSKAEQLAFNKKTHDFGEAEQNKRITAIFHFTNKTGKKLEIKKVHRSCGCTVPNLKKRSYEPNESGEISITFNTGRYNGNIGKSISFETIPPINPRPRIGIKVKVLPPEIIFEPRKIFIAKLTNSQPIMKTFKIYSKRLKEFKISNIKFNTNDYAISYEQYKDEIRKTHGYTVQVKIKSKNIRNNTKNVSANRFSENIKIQLIGTKQKELSYSIYGRLR